MPSRKTQSSRSRPRASRAKPAKPNGDSDQKTLPAEEAESEGLARALWSGTLSFGLVTIPVELMPATRHVRTSLRMLAPDGTPLARRYFCAKQHKPLEWDDIARGFERDDGKFVVIEDDELDALAPKQSRDIDVSRFVNRAELDPIFFERSYFLTPASDSNTAYRLLAETMQREKKAGIAEFVMRGKKYLVAVLAEDGILRAEILRFADEVRTPKDVGLPEPAKPNAQAVKRLRSAIRKLAKPGLAKTELCDRYWQRLTELAEQKHRKHRDVVTPETMPEEARVDVIDLMTVLKKSLSAANEGNGSKRKVNAKAAKRSTPRKAHPQKRERKAS